ncbi:MAG: FKBP-type peptidyl-prolyl cis-trans isomerase [Flavobacteriales bacterium]
MSISKNKVVSITYTLRLDHAEGELVQQVDNSSPLVFLFGYGQLLPKFEENLQGKTVGDTYEMTLAPQDGYGIREEQAVVDIPLDVFIVDGVLQEDMITVGNTVHLRNQDGMPLSGVVLKRSLEFVTVDFNHPLADKTLHFTGEVLDVREASADEIAHGHVHGEGGHQH